ncbi:Pkinase-domain-containing protein [Camillea tinctor]|nr:Pkinase-domain-containing protein [Camillea tinctor]
MDPIKRRGSDDVVAAAPPATTAASLSPTSTRMPANSRDVAMKRDRSRDVGDGSKDQERSSRNPRVLHIDDDVHSRLRSPSPASRPPPGHRGRPRGTRDDRSPHGNNESRSDANRRDFSQGASREQDDAPEVRDRPARHEQSDPDQRHDIPSSPRHGSAINNQSDRADRGRSFSPSSRKRRRSRSPLPLPPSRPKKSRRDRERDRRRRAERAERLERGHPPKGSMPPRVDRNSSPSRRRSPSPNYDDHRYRYSDRVEPPDPYRRRHSRSPPREPREANFDRGGPPSRPRVNSSIRDHSRSPRPSSRRSSFSHPHSPHRSLDRPPPRSVEPGSYSRRPSPTSFDPPRADHPPRSPRERGSRRSRKKAKHRDDPRFPPGGKLASGANSIEVNLSRRVGDHRNNAGAQGPSTNASQSHYNDPRHAHSPPHVNSGSSFQGSPRSQSPYGSGKTGRGSHHQYSPQSQRPASYAQGNHGPPSGPSGHHASSQSPPHPPTGPVSQSHSRGRGFSRGSFRGGFSPSRGSSHGNGAPKGARGTGLSDGTRDHSDPSGENTPRNHSPPRPTSNRSDAAGNEGDGDDGNLPTSSRDRRAEETASEKAANEKMPPPGPPPSAPTGPASSKFSFAFKTTNKAPVATPKPEISQKFSAGPKKDSQSTDDRDRDLPRDTPREPASARARADRSEYHANRPPPEQPRTRKVRRIRRQLKPKPELPLDHAKSESVFFRKPGNESVIGSGTYGKVFKGLHVYSKKLVALKRIRMEGEKDGFPVTAVREIKLLQSLKHDNIVRLHEVMTEANNCYMVFEYLSHDLTGLLNHPSFKLDAAQKKHLAKQLFEGLDYLHTRGVLHRDIKAANILVSSDGILKLADFGLARFYAKHHRVDYTNRVITIWYRSPELLLGETIYGAAVDIWSAACVMVEIFTRHAIFPGDGGEISQLEKIYNVLGTPNKTEWPGLVDMPWFELLRPGYRKKNVFAEKYGERVPPAAFELLADMFQYDPAKRPSAADVLEHPYFTTEHPRPRQAIELKDIQGDWHEFESKALRREKEKQDRERRAAKEGSQRDREKKRPLSPHDAQPDPKRPHVE